MENPRLADHLVGVELQLVELVEQRNRATVQHRDAEIPRLDLEIEQLQAELARSADDALLEADRAHISV
jgi:hypothetical protein